jgi:ERO1-like protein alpha
MKVWHILVVAAYIVGYYLLVNSYYLQMDPMQNMNAEAAPLLEQLVQTKYFRIIRLNVNQACPLGYLKKICKSNSCSVCRCDHKDIPQNWVNTDRVKSHSHGQDLWSPERDSEKGWVWHVEDESNDQGEYFDIYTNIESFTNYYGAPIWKLVYGENCFQSNYDEMCAEEQILYNVISGLHTSISTHLSRFYKNITTHRMWADLRSEGGHSQFHFNYSEYQRRVLDHPQRIKNLFFIYRLLAKAVK